MSTDILPFEFEDQQVRALDIDGEPWFVAKDMCCIDGCVAPSKTRNMCNRHYLRWWKATPPELRPTVQHEMVGEKFGRLTVLSRSGSARDGQRTWNCECACGATAVVPTGHLRSGHTRSCGCLADEERVTRAETHGITTGGTPRTLIIWSGMKARCLNPKAVSYKNYGGRGITICEEWMSFEAFHRWAMSSGYADGLQIDRIDNDGDYEPGNCRWVTQAENSRNTRRARIITAPNGESRTVTEWIERLGISKSAAYAALGKGQTYFVDRYLHTDMEAAA